MNKGKKAKEVTYRLTDVAQCLYLRFAALFESFMSDSSLLTESLLKDSCNEFFSSKILSDSLALISCQEFRMLTCQVSTWH